MVQAGSGVAAAWGAHGVRRGGREQRNVQEEPSEARVVLLNHPHGALTKDLVAPLAHLRPSIYGEESTAARREIERQPSTCALQGVLPD